MITVATQIRDAMFALLKTLDGYTTIRNVAMRQLQPEYLPAITVLRADEILTADEDATAGPPHFIHEATFHISIIRGFDDPVVLDGKSDEDMDLVQETILRDPNLMLLFEGISSIRRSHAWPQQGDTYYVELRLELTVQYRSTWQPVIPDDFREMDVKILQPGGDLRTAEIAAEFIIPE